MITSIIKPKTPCVKGWTKATWWKAPPQLLALGYPVEAWEHRANGLFVLSALEVAKEEAKPALGPEYHLSISAMGERCSTADAVWVLGQFDMIDAKEDNHVPNGKVRNFWRPVADHLSGIECACIADEPAVAEDKGDYIWRGVSA